MIMQISYLKDNLLLIVNYHLLKPKIYTPKLRLTKNTPELCLRKLNG